jgi:hypothetical protein
MCETNDQAADSRDSGSTVRPTPPPPDRLQAADDRAKSLLTRSIGSR